MDEIQSRWYQCQTSVESSSDPSPPFSCTYLFAGSLSSGGFASSLLGSSHCFEVSSMGIGLLKSSSNQK